MKIFSKYVAPVEYEDLQEYHEKYPDVITEDILEQVENSEDFEDVDMCLLFGDGGMIITEYYGIVEMFKEDSEESKVITEDTAIIGKKNFESILETLQQLEADEGGFVEEEEEEIKEQPDILSKAEDIIENYKEDD